MDNIFVLNGLSGFFAGPKPSPEFLATDLAAVALMALLCGAACFAIANRVERGRARWYWGGFLATLGLGVTGGGAAVLLELGLPQLILRKVILNPRIKALVTYRVSHVTLPVALALFVAIPLGGTPFAIICGIVAFGAYFLFLWKVFPATSLGQAYLGVLEAGEPQPAEKRPTARRFYKVRAFYERRTKAT